MRFTGNRLRLIRGKLRISKVGKFRQSYLKFTLVLPESFDWVFELLVVVEDLPNVINV